MLEEQRSNLRSNVEEKISDFKQEIEKFNSRWNALKPNKEIHKDLNPNIAHKITQQINEWRQEHNIHHQLLQQLKQECEFFELSIEIPLLDIINKQISLYESSWSIYSQFVKEMEAMENELWISFRIKLLDFQDFYQLWAGKIKNIQKQNANDTVIMHLKQEIKQFEEIWPVLRCITGELFEREHWNILFYKLGFSKNINLRNLSFGHLLRAKDNILKNQDALKHLANRALGEVTIREAIQELHVWIENAEFELIKMENKNRNNNSNIDICLIKGWKDLLIKVGDQLSLLSSLKESAFFESFSDRVASLEDKFIKLDESLRFLNEIQRKWVYLQPIFSRGALPKEQSRFARIDENFVTIMKCIQANQNVTNLLSIHNIQQTLAMLVDQLERCQKALSDYLEDKRSKFPRFYFLGDDDMLQILGQSMNPKVIQTHLKKLYQGIYRVTFSNDGKTIIAIQSSKNEHVTLAKPVRVTSDVEVWLNNLTKEMKSTLKQQLFECVKQFDIQQYPSQILCLCQSIHFTHNIERYLTTNASFLAKYHQELQSKLEKYTRINTTNDVLSELKIKSLILEIIHQLKVTELLIENRVHSVTDWLWLKQLRFYLNKSSQTVLLTMVNAEFLYSFEYQGNATKLVHTPLTDKCYLVLTQGMHLGYGGNPYGPAGTGKTESVKALAHLMGRQVLVFNCDEAIDFKSMGRIFTGLIQCGAWGCFDEFNRLKEDQLSAISQQIQIIQHGLRNKCKHILLLNKDIKLNQNSGIFVTMNPASKEYGGRSKLPDNLKQLFRSVAMTKPDSKLIAQTLLYAEGFKFAKIWGHKLTELYTLSKQLLSPQRHYDWGLRALKSVLNSSGSSLREIKKSQAQNVMTQQFEMSLLLKSLRINTLSKLTYKDSQTFAGLINDVFADKNMENEAKREESFEFKLEQQIKLELDKLNLTFVHNQCKKIIQLNEALAQRMGVVIVGPAQCGKSTLCEILYKSLSGLGKKIEIHAMNPKACDREQLLGFMDIDTREWFDGILTRSARHSISNAADITTWIICDGDIDPEWIESLNSVLDDNHLLSLPNGERIQFGDNINFIFETHDLSFASPATISRMGMIYLSQQDIQLNTFIDSWIIKNCPNHCKDVMQSWMNDIFMKSVEWIDKNIINNPNISSKLSVIVPTSIIGMVSNGLSQMIGVTDNKHDFLVRCIYGLSSNLPLTIADKIALKVAKLCGINLPSDNPSSIYWNQRNDTIASFANECNIDSEIWKTETFSIKTLPIIKTRNVCKNLHVMRQWLDNKYPFALVGSEGCGKNMLIKEAFAVYTAERGKQNKNVNIASIHCNGYTKASHVISKLSQSCSSFHSNNGKVLRPNGCDTLILYLKDINLSKPDNYNTSQIVELLQQFITYKGFYDTNLDFVHLEHIQFVFSMNHINTFGTHALSNRFTARIGMISIEEATKEELNIIYANYASIISSVSQLNATQTKLLQTASSAMIDIYYEIKTTFRRDEHRHFILTLRDLTQWIFGLIRYSLNSVGIIRVWYNECIRLFYDRMPNTNTKQTLQNMLTSVMNKYKLQFTAPKETTLYCTFVSAVDSESDDIKQPDEHQKCIKQMGLPFTSISLHDFQSVIAAKIRLYEKEYNELHLILFEEFLQHLQKIDRIITHGYFHNMLLIGNSGIGRKIIVKLLCYIHRIECKILKVSQEYCGKNQFANTLKNILKSTGVDGKKVLLYIEDCQLIDDVMLQCLNELVSTGDVIGLFEDKELDNLLTPIKEEYKQNGIDQYKSIYDYFISRVVAHLYIVLSVDPKNKTFVSICETNPSLITNCNVIWMGNQWRNESMIQYAHSQLQPILNHCADEKESKELLQQIQSSHCENIEYGACPRTFMVLVSVYTSIFKQKLSHNQHLKGHLMSGLRKLNEAKQIVDELSIKAKQQRELLKEKQGEADVALDKITKSMTLANARRAQAEELKISLAEKEVILNGRKQKVEIELADIQPMVDEAKAAVCGIRKDSLNELRMLRLPPESINDVLSGVLILMGNFDTSWQSMKSFLSKPSVKQEIINYNARRITPQILKKANKLLNDPKRKHSFDPKRIQRVSVAAAPLAAWFKANISYSLVLQKIAPLERELDTAQFDINDAQQNMNKVESELIELEQQVASLKVNFTKITSEAEVLKISLKNVEETLDRSQTLFDKLSDEKHRWDEQVNEINKITVLLPKYCLIAANFVTYLGGYPENIRVKCMDKWSEMCDVCDDDLSVLRFMNNESDLLKWKSEGLPDDKLSYENAMILLNCVLFPFIIDPNGDATTWLTNYLNAENISYEIIQQSDARFMKQLELSVRFGKTIIVTDVDDIHPSLYPLLRKNITKQGARQVISVGDKWIDYNEEFKLYLISRNMSFSLSSRCKPLVSCINFCVTWSGLESQLLAITMRSQQPELESKKSQLLGEEEKYKVQLAELEKELLRELAMSSGNILYNKSLIESLNNTKIQSENIKKALNESKIVQNDLNKQREIYRVLAVIGSNAYFTIKSLQSLNNMYQFSLFAFLSLFASNLKSICHSSDNKNVAQHIANLEENLVSILYNYISRSLFKCDRLTFGLYFVHSLYGSKTCKENEWEYFIGEIISCSNSKNIAINADIASIALPWIHIDIQQSFKDLCSNFEALVLKCEFEKYTNKWSDWIQSNNPETDIISLINNINFTDFEQLLLIQTFRADKLSNAINLFINKYIKGRNKNKIKSLKELYVSSKQSNDFLILFVTTSGADPSRELRELALNVVGGDHYFEMAMGCGQELKAEAINLIKSGSQKGYWICLKNLHLVTPWLKQELQAVILSLKKQKISSDFRLWLTTESHSNFAPLLLQNSVTITCEPPPGVKQNLNRTLSIWSDEYMAGSNKNKFRTQLLFILAWFHAIIQERRTYVPCGWNKYYEFNESDLRASMEIIDSIFKKNKLNNICQIPWKLLCGLLNQAIYGGRIDNNIDLNTLDSYLKSYFNANTLSKVSKWKYLCHIPSSIQKYEYVNLINTMPSSDSPDMFALPLNANNIVSLQNMKQLFQSLKILSVSSLDDISYASISKLRQSQRKRIYPLIKLWKTIKTNDNISSNNNVNDINPVINALSLEIEKVRILINYINKSMTDIEVGLFGNGSLSMRLQENICQLIAGIVPWDWNKLWNKGHGPSDPKIFLTLLINRKEILNTWMRESSLCKLTINIMIGELFYPITFLNAFKQYTAHKLQTTMDNLQFKCVWDRKLVHHITHIPILNIDGLYIQGALFDGKNIKPVSCKDSALSKVPVCYIYYHLIDHEKNNKNSDMQCIKIPTYYSLDRSYKVFDVDVIMNVDNINQAKWSLSGLAFIMTNVY